MPINARSIVRGLALLAAFGSVGSGPVMAQLNVEVEQVASSSCPEPCRPLAVIFIHGLNGNSETWGTGDVNFPKLLADDPGIGAKLDIFRVNYKSCFFGGAAPSITDIHKELIGKLDEKLVNSKYDKVVFIAHSLGGIVSFRYMQHLKSRYGHEQFAHIRLAMTYGSPMTGGNWAGLAGTFSSCPHLRVLTDLEKNDFEQALKIDTTDMFEKRGDRGCPKFNVYAAYEKLPTSGLSLIVSKDSATNFVRPSEGDKEIGFDADHSGLVKPASADDEKFKWARDALLACDAGETVCAGPIPPSCR